MDKNEMASLMPGARELDDVKAEVWKASRPGEFLMGRLERIESGKYNDLGVFGPVIIGKPDGSAECYAEYRVPINSSLRSRVTPALVGRLFTIGLKRLVATDAGNPMRDYRVVLVDDSRPFAAKIDQMSGGALDYGVGPVSTSAPFATYDDDGDDDLPF